MSLIDRLWRLPGSGGFLAEIEGLRFFGVLPVVLDRAWWTYRANVRDPGFALEPQLGRVFPASEMGVQIFFVISGYVLGLGFFRAARDARDVGLGRDFFRRLCRLQPPFIFIMTIFFALLLTIGRLGVFEGLEHYLASITCLHGLIYLEPSPINTVTGSLEVELEFYVFAPALYAIYRLEPRLAYAIIAGGMLLFVATAHLLGDFYLTLLSHGHLFLLGAAFPILSRFKIPARLTFVLLAAPLPLFMIEADYSSVCGNLAKIALLSAVFAMTLGCAPVRRSLSLPFLSEVGGAFYSIYLIHYSLLSPSSKVWAKTALPGGLSVSLALTLLCVLVVGMAFYIIAQRAFMSRSAKKIA